MSLQEILDNYCRLHNTWAAEWVQVGDHLECADCVEEYEAATWD